MGIEVGIPPVKEVECSRGIIFRLPTAEAIQINDWVAVQGGQVVKAIANNPGRMPTRGVVVDINPDNGEVIVLSQGFISLSGLMPDTQYYISDTQLGAITNIATETGYSQCVGEALTPELFSVNIDQTVIDQTL